MVVQHNISAMNSNRQLSISQGFLQSTTEKLSSGYKVNRAADDAAGLSISEKMRKQIRGLTQGSLNAEDGISYVQTAEGALNEVHDMLQRGRELAVQAANGTNSEAEREAIQAEINQLKTEIGRVGDTTKFNEQDVFDHSTTSNIVRSRGSISPAEAEKKMLTLTSMRPVTIEESDFAGAATHVTGGASATIMQNFAVALRDTYVPTILGTLQNSIFNGVATTTGSAITMGLKFYSRDDSSLAYVSSNGIGFELGVNTKFLSVSGDSIVMNDDLATTIAHELTHGIMFDMVTNGMLGVGCDALPGWFVEGTAQVAGGARNYLGNINLNSDSDIKDKMAHLEDGGYASYSQGYLASAYLGYLCGGAGAVDSNTISTGLNKLLKEISDGKSMSQAISELTNDKFSSLSDFVDAVTEGKAETISFIHSFINAIGSGTGSAALGSLSQPKGDLLNGSGGNYFTLDITKEYAESLETNKTGFSGKNPYTGGGATSTSGLRRDGTQNPDAVLQWTDDVSTSGSFVGHGQFSLHVGADADMTNKIAVKKLALTVEALKLDKVDVMSESKATKSFKYFDFAISTVSMARSMLGAVQNRLEHTVKNLDNIVENTTASESKIRDTDMAKTMVDYSNTNILAQAGQSMLAQANQSNQGVLALL